MQLIRKSITLTAAMTLLASCATIIEGSDDKVQLASPAMTPMTCTAANKRGSWTGTAPGEITVLKSRTDLKVNCNDGAGDTAGSTVVSDIEPWVFGNILIGGIIGLGVDWITGAAYDYPETSTVTSVAPASAMMPAPAPVIQPEPIGTTLEPIPAPAASTTPAATTTTTTTTAPTPAQPGTIAPLPFGGPTPAPGY